MTTGINYLDEVWNPVTGCSGKGCKTRDICWARDMVKRFPWIHGYEQKIVRSSFDNREYGVNSQTPLPFSSIKFHPSRLDKPLHWRKPRRIGVCFLGDLFDEQVRGKWINEVWMKIFNRPEHRYFILTKQPQNLLAWTKKKVKACRWPNDEIWPSWAYLGVSITDQEDADRMIPELLRTAGRHWVSIEPYLKGPIEMSFDGISWVIIGAHNKPKRYPCNLDWIRSVVEQCRAAEVSAWVKQIHLNGKLVHDIEQFPEDLRIRECPPK